MTSKLQVLSQELRMHRGAVSDREALEILILYVTNHCNMKCEHCFFADNLNDGTTDLPPERAKRIFDSIPRIREEIAITGGEPILHRKLPELVRNIHDAECSRDIQINTNGWYVDRTLEYAKDIKQWNRKRISFQISLDGLEETHDRIRGLEGSFQRAMETAENLKSLSHYSEPGFFTPVFLMVINSQNYREVRPLAEFLFREFGLFLAIELVRGTQFSVWNVPEGMLEDDFNPPSLELPPESEWDSIYEDLRALNREWGYPFRHFATKMKYQFEMLRTQKRVVRCAAPSGVTPVVYANGDVATCEFAKPFANLNEFGDDFSALWNSDRARQNRAALTGCHCTHACFLVPSLRRDLGKNFKLLVDL
ncbi:MAG: radical SAM protein [Candidatus Omnitrophica bacterium]|nr:radical SAM protein [Candidatus Omnitrophota bacterium]